MAIVFMTDPATGRCALYDENGTSGSTGNPNATRNAPLNNPASHLDKVYFHSDLDYMEVGIGPSVVTIVHAGVAAVTPSDGFTINANQVVYDTASAVYTLATHGLGYVPDFMVVVDGDALYPGKPVQRYGDGRARYVTAYATTTGLYLEERVSRTPNALPAVSKDYTVIIFNRPPAPAGNVLLEFDPATSVVTMGKGKFRSDRRYLQLGAGGSPFGFAQGRTIDLANGAPRLVDPDGSITDIVPAGAQTAFSSGFQTSGWSYGPSGAYSGSFAGGPAIQVKVP